MMRDTGYTGRKVTVLGLGREGVSVVRFLAERGAEVTVSDSKRPEELRASLDAVSRWPVRLSLGANIPEAVAGADALFVSPGVPLTNPVVQAARERGVRLDSSLRLFFALCPAPIAGITGSSGKTTTTTLLGEMLRTAGRRVFVGGNIGKTVLEALPEITPDQWVVLEISSFQLELMDRSPHVAVITNVTPNHLDVHPDMEDYIRAKKRILDFQRSDDWAVLNEDDEVTRELASTARARPVRFSRAIEPEGDAAFVRKGVITVRLDGRESPVMARGAVRLRGEHNLENALAACAAGAVCGLPAEAMATAASQFAGVEHRLESVRTLAGVEYVNDSIATTPERTLAGLRAFDRPIVLLLGGRDKHLPLESLAREAQRRCRAVVLYGEAAGLIEEALKEATEGGDGPALVRLRGFAEAVAKASEQARPGDVVLLSPACTSYDMFANFEERGREFKRLGWEMA